MIYTAIATKLRAAAGAGVTVVPSTEQAPVTESLPRVIFTDLGGEEDQTDQGGTGIIPARIQVDVFADKLTTAHPIALSIRQGLREFAGTVDGTVILLIRTDGSIRFGKVDKAAGANQSITRLTFDLIVTYREPLTP